MSDRPHPLDQVEIRFAAGGGLLVLVLVAAHLAGLPDGYVFGLLLVTTTASAAVVGRAHAALLGLTAWALCTGFLTHHDGVLTFGRHDLVLMAELVVAAIASSHLARVGRIEARAQAHAHVRQRRGAHAPLGGRTA